MQPQPLSYYSPAEPNERSGPTVASIIDGFCVMLAICFLNAFLDACQINLKEAPMNGGRSAYIAAAPCNEQWQRQHPDVAAFIQGFPAFDCAALLLLFPYMFTLGTLPYVVTIWLAIRTWQVRRHRTPAFLLACALVGMLAIVPWIHLSMAVIAD